MSDEERQAVIVKEFYGEREQAVSAPEDDLVMTVRMQGPNEQARRLDATTPRAIRTDCGLEPWTRVTGEGSVWLTHDEVRDWFPEHPLTYTTAQRLAQGQQKAPEGPAPEILGDEDEELPFKDKRP